MIDNGWDSDIDSSSDFTRPLSPERLADDKRKAREAGLDVVEGDPYTILIDLDGPEAATQFANMIDRAIALFDLRLADRGPSKSREPWHEHVILRSDRPLDVPTRVALQAILGSDPVRELLALKRLENGCEEPSTLFRPTVEARS